MNFLKKLQSRPYAEKIRILKIAAVLTAVLILGIWALTLKFRSTGQADTSQFEKLFQNLKDFKSKLDG